MLARQDLVLAMLEAARRSTALITALSGAADDRAAVPAVAELLDCAEASALAVLSMAVRRFSRASLARLTDELEGLVAQLDPTKVVSPVAADLPSQERLVTRPVLRAVPPLGPASELEEPRRQAALDRPDLLTALADAVGDPQALLAVVGAADDDLAAAAALQGAFGWDARQVTVVLDMQLRVLTRHGREQIASERDGSGAG